MDHQLIVKFVMLNALLVMLTDVSLVLPTELMPQNVDVRMVCMKILKVSAKFVTITVPLVMPTDVSLVQFQKEPQPQNVYVLMDTLKTTKHVKLVTSDV